MRKPTQISAVFACLALAAAPAYAAAAAQTQAKAAATPIFYDMSRLPAPVRAMRERLLKAAKSGDIEALRPLLATKSGAVRITPAGSKQDPIAYLKEISADGEGLEILANIVQILQTGAVRQNSGGQEDSYVWPYFVAVPPGSLSKTQLVEAYEIMSVDDLDTIKEIGHYMYFRLGIAADGQWRFFLTGDDSADKPNADTAPALPNRAEPLPSPDDADDLPNEE